jgi:hypothetical protein
LLDVLPISPNPAVTHSTKPARRFLSGFCRSSKLDDN